ncbi:hypothetical protein LQ327_01075 [Actinomycetospora endophytica]|uniref:DUF4190 domain-containing protein n=1 Tax=Actinomycetospora endophytica TaxID=2291215 RepID=A0ABS8P145_9PSEU|nr:hypothetical protein [Actinomycetospora endophytica]MCD2191982.1 hypothetical protein [Actinomycetospora endophytica]
MKIEWAALGLVSVVSLAVGVVVVVLFALGAIGLSSRRRALDGGQNGRGLGVAMSTAVAGACFAAVAAILVYSLYIIAAA